MLSSDDITQVCETYIQFIGEINESSAMRIKDLCENYAKDKIIDAFKAAARKGIKNWRYIEVILEKETKANDPDRFIHGKYGDMVIRTSEDMQRIMAMRKQARNQQGGE